MIASTTAFAASGVDPLPILSPTISLEEQPITTSCPALSFAVSINSFNAASAS